MMGSITHEDSIDIARQRGRWFLLLGALLGGIIAVATAFAFYLENSGRHIGGGSAEGAHDIAIGLGVALTVIAIVIVLLVWRARLLLQDARSLEDSSAGSDVGPTNLVSEAVATWRSSALRPSRSTAGRPRDNDVSTVPASDSHTSTSTESTNQE